MRVFLFALAISALVYAVNERLIDLAISAGYQKYNKTAVLEDKNQNQVECHKFAIGFLNEKGLDAKFQSCIDKHKAEGYAVIDYQSL